MCDENSPHIDVFLNGGTGLLLKQRWRSPSIHDCLFRDVWNHPSSFFTSLWQMWVLNVRLSLSTQMLQRLIVFNLFRYRYWAKIGGRLPLHSCEFHCLLSNRFPALYLIVSTDIVSHHSTFGGNRILWRRTKGKGGGWKQLQKGTVNFGSYTASVVMCKAGGSHMLTHNTLSRFLAIFEKCILFDLWMAYSTLCL